MLRITSHPVLSGLLLCLSFGTMSSFAAAQASVSADLSAPNFSSFSRNNNFVRWEQLVGLITAQGLSNPVANIASGTTPRHARNGERRRRAGVVFEELEFVGIRCGHVSD